MPAKPKTPKMASTDTVRPAARLIDHLKEFVNGTSVPRSLTVSDTELQRLESSAILQLLWLVSTSSHLEFAVSVKNGSNQDKPQLTTFTLLAKVEHTSGQISNSPTSCATSEKELKHDQTKVKVQGHGTG